MVTGQCTVWRGLTLLADEKNPLTHRSAPSLRRRQLKPLLWGRPLRGTQGTSSGNTPPGFKARLSVRILWATGPTGTWPGHAANPPAGVLLVSASGAASGEAKGVGGFSARPPTAPPAAPPSFCRLSTPSASSSSSSSGSELSSWEFSSSDSPSWLTRRSDASQVSFSIVSCRPRECTQELARARRTRPLYWEELTLTNWGSPQLSEPGSPHHGVIGIAAGQQRPGEACSDETPPSWARCPHYLFFRHLQCAQVIQFIV